eukprot:CAMPEP_0116849626 /NCGR_PEP_ID=MMETSP0418-20121206/15681_1 /TAXON_ID=1158023 /ORGANISM="Astrosyne radiata, Strain 13vi08-1A" /LENGTH=83 /DNA_ID=CAMNT_0004481377 /DNA_START=368 /DNA_END=616 /DNA_ORIENTATION=-
MAKEKMLRNGSKTIERGFTHGSVSATNKEGVDGSIKRDGSIIIFVCGRDWEVPPKLDRTSMGKVKAPTPDKLNVMAHIRPIAI